MSELNVLVSSAGRRVILVDLFRRALRDLALAGKVIAADMVRLSATFHHADLGLLVPRCTSGEFVPTMLELCRQHRVKLVIPTIDTELPIYAAHREEFRAEGIEVAVSSPEAVAIAGDKVNTHRWLTEAGLPTVRQTEPEEVLAAPGSWRFPLIVKPRGGSLSQGVARVHDEAALRTATSAGGFIVQTIAPGHEFTIDALADRSGKCVCAVPRKRLEVRGGEISKGLTVRSEPLERLAQRACEALPGAYGGLNIQIFLDEESGELNIIEINARFGGGFPLSCEAGANYPRWLIEELLGLTSTASATAWEGDRVMLRYDDAVFVSAEEAGLR